MIRSKRSLFDKVKALFPLAPHTHKDQVCGRLESGCSLQREEPLHTSGLARYPENVLKMAKNPTVAAPSFPPSQADALCCCLNTLVLCHIDAELLSSLNNVIFASFPPWKPRTKLCMSGNKAITQWSVFTGRDDSNQAS